MDSTVIAQSAAVDNETKEKVKALKEELAKVEEAKDTEVTQLKKVKDKLASIVDTKEYKPDLTKMKGGFEDAPEKKPDLSAFKKNLAKIEAENEAKADAIEAREEMIKNVPKNPVVEAAEKAEEEHAAEMKKS